MFNKEIKTMETVQHKCNGCHPNGANITIRIRKAKEISQGISHSKRQATMKNIISFSKDIKKNGNHT